MKIKKNRKEIKSDKEIKTVLKYYFKLLIKSDQSWKKLSVDVGQIPAIID